MRRSACLLVLVALAACGSGDGGAQSMAGTGTGGSGGAGGVGGAGSVVDGPSIAGCPVFPPENAWNLDVSAYPVHADSDTFVDSIGRDRAGAS